VWGRSAIEQINKRLDDQNRVADQRHAEMSAEHRDVRQDVRNIEKHVDEGFARTKAEIDQRHAENRGWMRQLAIGIFLAFLVSYLAQHGFHVMAVGN